MVSRLNFLKVVKTCSNRHFVYMHPYLVFISYQINLISNFFFFFFYGRNSLIKWMMSSIIMGLVGVCPWKNWGINKTLTQNLINLEKCYTATFYLQNTFTTNLRWDRYRFFTIIVCNNLLSKICYENIVDVRFFINL